MWSTDLDNDLASSVLSSHFIYSCKTEIVVLKITPTEKVTHLGFVDHEAVFLDYITMYKHTYISLALRIVSLTYLFLYNFSYHLKNLYTGFSTV